MRHARKTYEVIAADPPWKFGDALPGPGRGAGKHYPVMSTDAICGFLEAENVVPAADAFLFMWRVAAMQEDALRVVRAWGFQVKTEIVWVKLGKGNRTGEVDTESGDGLHFGMGRYTRAAHETCLLCVRGKAAQMVTSRSVRSVIFAPSAEHSAKPPAFYRLVERLVGAERRRIELFSRVDRPGWDVLGNQLPERKVSLAQPCE